MTTQTEVEILVRHVYSDGSHTEYRISAPLDGDDLRIQCRYDWLTVPMESAPEFSRAIEEVLERWGAANHLKNETSQ